MSKVEDLLRICNKRIQSEFRAFFWTFNLDFEPVYNLIAKDFDTQNLSEYELQQFIRICDNRLDLFKAFLGDLSVVLSVDFIGLSIVATLISGKGTLFDMLFLKGGDFLLSILIWIMIVAFIGLFYAMAICRRLTYVWTTFKEKAILMQKSTNV